VFSRFDARSIALPLLAILAIPGCNSIDPLCGSARPVPALTSISPTSVTEAQVKETFTLNVTGSHFVAASVVVVNKIQVATDVTSSTTIKATVGPADLDGAGTYGVWVNTPAGNSGDLGCNSGGSSGQTTLTVK
jgi:hypothetical protein